MTDPQTPATCPGCADWLNNATPHVNHPQTPATEAGRRLTEDYHNFPPVVKGILAIEAEARADAFGMAEGIYFKTSDLSASYQEGRADALREAAEAVRSMDPYLSDGGALVRDAVLAILDPQP